MHTVCIYSLVTWTITHTHSFHVHTKLHKIFSHIDWHKVLVVGYIFYVGFKLNDMVKSVYVMCVCHWATASVGLFVGEYVCVRVRSSQ